MDWQIRIALIIVGIGVISFIVYDYNRRKKDQAQKQRLIEQMRASAEQVDGLGFDINGVGSVRKAGDELNSDNLETETSSSSSTEPVYQQESLEEPVAEEKLVTEPQVEQTPAAAEETVSQPRVKTSPTEQMKLGDFDDDNNTEASNEPELVFSLILKSAEDKPFKGHEFMPILLSQGLRHGDMGIFHRHLGTGKQASVLYSVANAINPGTFDINNIETFETPAFAIFMTVPGPKDPMMAYDAMVKTTRLLKQELGGQILDDTKSVFTEQTQQHQRDVLQEYLTKNSIKR